MTIKTGQTLSKPVRSSYMTKKKHEEETYPIINDVRTLHLPTEHGTSHQKEISTMAYNTQSKQSEATNEFTSQPLSKEITPQRPQDLLDNISLDVARANLKSSAQYRKSYAFKIWRDRGSFPYRLAEQPVVKDVVQRKKSKKHLNAIRAQRDREREEAWKAFKNCRITSNEMKLKRTSQLSSNGVEETRQHEKDQFELLLSDIQDNDPKPSPPKHQNSIRDYFKNKKESAERCQPLASPSKSIPTSVIHVHTTEACQVSKQATQVEQSNVTSNIDAWKVHNSTTQPAVPTTVYKDNVLPDEKDSRLFERSVKHTSSNEKGNIFVREQEQLNANTLNDRQQISSETMTRTSLQSLEGRNSPYIPTKQNNLSLPSYSAKSFTTFSNVLADKSANGDESFEELSTEHQRNVISAQPSPSPHPTEESNDNAELEPSNLALIIKDSLTNKYRKENIKPISRYEVTERNQKRVRNESWNGEEEELQRSRTKRLKATMFTCLDETVATNLADGIHNVNSEYFPIEALANKAVSETSSQIPDGIEKKLPTKAIKHKLDEIERAR